MTWTELLGPLLQPTALTGGGAGALDAIETVDLDVGVRAIVVATLNVSIYRLVAGTDAESSPSVIRPDDYDGVTNQKVWKKLTWV